MAIPGSDQGARGPENHDFSFYLSLMFGSFGVGSPNFIFPVRLYKGTMGLGPPILFRGTMGLGHPILFHQGSQTSEVLSAFDMPPVTMTMTMRCLHRLDAQFSHWPHISRCLHHNEIIMLAEERNPCSF